jgi:Family of unknown function (DUF5829)
MLFTEGWRSMKPLLSICFLLLSYAPAFSADAPPPVLLSHFWIALDQATYDALRTSNQVAALGAVKEQKVVAGSENWSGFYWTARQTYMEFFGAAALPDKTLVGDCGIGLAVETPGGVAAVAERLRTVFGDKIETEKQVRTTATGDIPWYTSTHMKDPQTTAMWVMELDPGYLAARHPEASVREPLSRQQERSWDYRPDQTLDNVVGLTLALNQEKASELATQLGLFGWSVHRTGTDFFAVGPQVKIRVVPAGTRAGIKQVDLHLRRSVPKQTIQLGNAELRLAGNTGQLVLWK